MPHILYNSSSNLWNFFGSSEAVRVYGIGDVIPASAQGVKAATYAEAFEKLTGTRYAF